jgi:tRNA A37 threonylcarbamoyladenosine synthetase subunit TsaC/SUA5/YrdC
MVRGFLFVLLAVVVPTTTVWAFQTLPQTHARLFIHKQRRVFQHRSIHRNVQLFAASSSSSTSASQAAIGTVTEKVRVHLM